MAFEKKLLAPHVERALHRGAQAKAMPVGSRSGQGVLAPHVQAAIRPVAQARVAPAAGSAVRPLAPHVEAAIGAVGQARLAGTGASRTLAPHVREALGPPAPAGAPLPGGTGPRPALQARLGAGIPATASSAHPPLPAGRGRGVVQRMLPPGLGRQNLENLYVAIASGFDWTDFDTARSRLRNSLLSAARRDMNYDADTDDVLIGQILDDFLGPAVEPTTNITNVATGPTFTEKTSSKHLEDFNTRGVGSSSEANNVNVQLVINGEVKSTASGKECPWLKDSAIDSEMQIPGQSTELCVIDSRGDGEVAGLQRALKIIARYFSQSGVGDSDQVFTVSLYGAWGACDGCKKRIERFVELWGELAKRVMSAGKRAKLKLTYQYLNKPTPFGRGEKKSKYDTVYGWYADEAGAKSRKGPFFHTIKASVTGG